jgi:hypothetical protein
MKQKAIKEDLKVYASLEAVKNSEGGKILIKSLSDDITAAIMEISAKYKEATHTELIALAAKLSERITILRSITRSSKNKDLAKEELDRLIKEEGEEE